MPAPAIECSRGHFLLWRSVSEQRERDSAAACADAEQNPAGDTCASEERSQPERSHPHQDTGEFTLADTHATSHCARP